MDFSFQWYDWRWKINIYVQLEIKQRRLGEAKELQIKCIDSLLYICILENGNK